MRCPKEGTLEVLSSCLVCEMANSLWSVAGVSPLSRTRGGGDLIRLIIFPLPKGQVPTGAV
jgi:hypothetical protein